MKLCVTELRILANSDIRILLTKLEALLREEHQVGINMQSQQSQIQGLHLAKQELLSLLGSMVPYSELHSSQAEASKLRDEVKGLNQLLQRAHVEMDNLKCTMQV